MSLSNLAVLGGDPQFSDSKHVGRPNIGDSVTFLSRAADILQRQWLTNDGKYVRELEERLSAFLGVRHTIAVTNATIGLELLTRALGLTGEVIVPSFTFVASAHALTLAGVTPVFTDVLSSTHCLDPEAVEANISQNTSAILGVHLWGNVCNTKKLDSIASRHDLVMIYDAAHAFGCRSGDGRVGGFGRAEVFSFHATKVFNSFEGGCVTTNDDELAHKLRLTRNFGFAGYDNVVNLGTNAKMTEICAAMGLTNLESFELCVAANRANAERYHEELATIPGIKLISPFVDSEVSMSMTNAQYIVVEVSPMSFPLTRDELMTVLWREGVIARRYFYPGCHNMEPYKSTSAESVDVVLKRLPITEYLCRNVLVLPTGTATKACDISVICGIILQAASKASAVRASLELERHGANAN